MATWSAAAAGPQLQPRSGALAIPRGIGALAQSRIDLATALADNELVNRPALGSPAAIGTALRPAAFPG